MKPWRRNEFRVQLWLSLLFVASRLCFYASGVRFDTSSLQYGWQLLDLPLLQHDLVASLWYQHGQPPLFNLFVALMAKLGLATPSGFALVFAGLGLFLCLGIHSILRNLGVPRPTPSAAALVFCVNPSVILYENWLFYTYPIAVLLLLSTLFLHRVCKQGQRTDMAILLCLLSTCVLTRSLFHLVWLVLICALGTFLLSRNRRFWFLCGTCAVAVCASVYAKNALLFGVPSSSSWLGLSLARMTLQRVPPDELEELIARGTLSAQARIRPFSSLLEHPGHALAPPGSHIVLSARQTGSGSPNFNHWAYLNISRQYRQDSVALIRARPEIYLRSVGAAWEVFCTPPSGYTFLQPNRAHIKRYESLFSRFVLGARSGQAEPDGNVLTSEHIRSRFCYIWALLVALSLPWAVYRGFVGLRSKEGQSDRAHGIVLLFLAANALFIALIGNAFELGENQRFRMLAEPLLYCLVVTCLAACWRRAWPWLLRLRTCFSRGATVAGP